MFINLFLFPIFLTLQDLSNKKNNFTQIITEDDLSIEMVFIPEGKFRMGKDTLNSYDYSPSNDVEVSSFWISKFEITWDIYQLFMDQTNFDEKSDFSRADFIDKIDGLSGPTTPYVDMSFGMGKNNFPAVNMTHFAASKFCEWLSSKTGFYYRLPTEAEWEYACSDEMDNLKIDDFAWNRYNSDEKYQKVGQKKPNIYGLHDMLGNVAEWTADIYNKDVYSKKRKKNPFESGENKYPRVIRGGSWDDESSNLKSYYRSFSTKELQRRDPQIPKSLWWNTDAPHIGFRIVRPFNKESQKLKKMFWNYSD
jgi:formylglycine-generating enzyme required for sulfatase activity|tara:strand:+ start:2530 stop:3453 length:924 start_codon:yes stop_codon:yes gene_type:complete